MSDPSIELPQTRDGDHEQNAGDTRDGADADREKLDLAEVCDASSTDRNRGRLCGRRESRAFDQKIEVELVQPDQLRKVVVGVPLVSLQVGHARNSARYSATGLVKSLSVQ